MRRCTVYRLGMVPYEAGLRLQQQALELRKRDEILDILFLLEHPHVFTLGRNARPENVLVDGGMLKEKGIPVVQTERGGDVTYHGPGQLIGYPILNLRENGLTVSSLVHKLEEAMIEALRAFGIDARRSERGRGVFVKDKKIGALGLRIKDGISLHGFALNVNTDLRYFDYIVPCGLQGIRVTSMAELLGHSVDMAQVQDAVIANFAEEFGFEIESGKEEAWLAASLTG